jgi:hypothetical protein
MQFKYSIGNHKIGTDTLIFNMGPALTCPSRARGLCQVPAGRCYAMKAERQYPQVIPYRRAQTLYWARSSALKISADILEALKHHKRIRYTRVNESGDFRSKADIDKLISIAKLVPAIIFYVYTARKDLRFPSPRPSNLIINGSGFMLDNDFHYEAKDARFTCPGNCRACSLCKEKGGRVIKIAAH